MNHNQGFPPGYFAAVAALAAALACAAPSLNAQEQGVERAPGCYLAGGTHAFENGDLSLAEREFRGAIKAFPGMPEAREYLAITLAREAKLDEAVAEFGGILADRPNWPEANYNLGLVLLQENDLIGAQQHFRKAVQVDPAYPEALNSLGLTLE